jgi:hypothetical protein
VAWRKIEAAKHRLYYTIMALRLPTEPGNSGGQRLAFEFLASSPQLDGSKVMTGHNGGVITLALEEAHDAQREAIRTSMGEPYRTLLGHFRHEIGHYYWDVLVRDNESLEECRNVFGDDSLDYGQALQSYYQYGPTGKTASSAPMPQPIRGKISLRRGHITYTSSTRWKWREPSGCMSIHQLPSGAIWRPRLTSTLISSAMYHSSSILGFR